MLSQLGKSALALVIPSLFRRVHVPGNESVSGAVYPTDTGKAVVVSWNLINMKKESALQRAQEVLMMTYRRRTSEPVDEETWKTLIQIAKWAKTHAAFPGPLDDVEIPPPVRKWSMVRFIAKAVITALIGT
jgi:hypothetical protein